MVEQQHDTEERMAKKISIVLENAEKTFGKIVDTYRGRLYVAVEQAIREGRSPEDAVERVCRGIRKRISYYRNERIGKQIYGILRGAKRRRMKPDTNY